VAPPHRARKHPRLHPACRVAYRSNGRLGGRPRTPPADPLPAGPWAKRRLRPQRRSRRLHRFRPRRLSPASCPRQSRQRLRLLVKTQCCHNPAPTLPPAPQTQYPPVPSPQLTLAAESPPHIFHSLTARTRRHRSTHAQLVTTRSRSRAVCDTRPPRVPRRYGRAFLPFRPFQPLAVLLNSAT
jgi:hypothetical protein